jgi:hypothetical protein
VGDSRSLERSFQRSSRAAGTFEHDIGRAGRGVAAVSLGFAGLGRSLAFASSAFIGAAGLTVGLKAAVSGAEELAKAQASASTALGHTGQNVEALLPKYQAVAKAAQQFGVSQADALGGLAKATTLTGNAAAAQRAYQEALVISKALHISFDSALTATSKGQEGITTSLRRYGIEIGKTTSGQKQFEIVMSRFGGQARANTSDLDKLRANAANLAAQLGGPLLGAAEAASRGLSDAISRISQFASRVGAETTIQGKLNVIWTGVRSASAGAVVALASAVRGIDWTAVWSGARGIADGLQKKLEAVDWGSVGAAIGNGIADAVGKAIPAARDIGKRLSDAVASINVVEVGKKLGPGLAAAVVTAFATLTDPAFWLHNWQLALSIGLVAFGDGIGKFAGEIAIKFGEAISVALLAPLERIAPRLAQGLLRLITDAGGAVADGVLRIATAVERVSPRIAKALLDGLLVLPKLAERALRPLVDSVSGVFGRLGRITRFTLKVAGVDLAIHTITRAVQRLADIIGHGLEAGWHILEKQALTAALAIVEPFSHLPGFLGGGPFQKMKAALQHQLDGMDKAAQSTSRSIQDSMTAASASVAAAASGTLHQGHAPRQAVGEPQAPSAATLRSLEGITGKATSIAADAAATTVAKGFVLPFRLQLAQAKASATKAVSDDLAVAREVRDFIVKAIPHLHGQKLIDAYTQLGQINQQIAGSVQQAAKIGKDFAVPLQLQVQDARSQALGQSETGILRQIRAAAERALRSGKLSAQGQISAWNEIASVNQQLKDAAQQVAQKGKDFTEPIKLQIEEARALALGISDTAILKKEKAAAERALKSGKLSAQGQIDAWNQIAQVNQQIGAAAKSALGSFKQINTRKITAGLNLTPEQRAQLRARLSQIGPGGTVPSQGVGAFGFQINAQTDRPIIVKMDGKKIGESVTRRQQKARRRNSSQTRGPNAGMAFGS